MFGRLSISGVLAFSHDQDPIAADERTLNNLISCYGAGSLPPCTVSLGCFGRPPMRRDSQLALLVPLFPIFLLGMLPMLLFPLVGFAGLAVIGVLVIACGFGEYVRAMAEYN